MPIYSYTCKPCNHSFEELKPFSEKTDVKCPLCKKILVKNITAPILMGMSNVEVWDKHADYIKKMNPKYVKDGKTGKRKRLR